MAMERNFFENGAHFDAEDNFGLNQKWKSFSAPTDVSDNDDDCFDCNICLDSAHDPVVTLCGHLYCWPCIYKWLHVRSSSLDNDQQQPNCPVCKASISQDSLVPLYGRGKSPSESDSKTASQDVVPRRPLPSGLNTITSNPPVQSQRLHPNFLEPHSQAFHDQQYLPNPYGGYATMASSNFGGTTMMSFFLPVIGMFGELMFSRILGTSNTGLFYPYPHANPLIGSNNTRMRRQEVQLDKSLNRVSIFFLCCIILCLLLF